MLSSREFDMADFSELNIIWRTQIPSKVKFEIIEELAFSINETLSIPEFKKMKNPALDFFTNYPARRNRENDIFFLRNLSNSMLEIARELGKYTLLDRSVIEQGIIDKFFIELLQSCFYVSYKCGNKSSAVMLVKMMELIPEHRRHENHARIVKEFTKKIPDDFNPLDWHKIESDEPTSRRKLKNEEEPSKLEAPAPGTSIYVCTSLVELSSNHADKQLRERAKNLNKLMRLRPWRDDVVKKLISEFPWANEAINRIALDIGMAKRMRGQAVKIAPICLVGSAGVGKSRLARRLAELVSDYEGPSFTIVSASGSSDNRTMQGTAKGYGSATPSLPVSLIMESECPNPIIVCEEIDKITKASHNGDLAHTLLMMTEKSTSEKWFDECLSVTCDISYVSWIFTANKVDDINPLLKARLKIVEVPKPRPQDFDVLLTGIFQDIADENFSEVELLPTIEPMILQGIKKGYQKGNISARFLAKVVKHNLELALEYENQQMRH
jgi:hypothetical protein